MESISCDEARGFLNIFFMYLTSLNLHFTDSFETKKNSRRTRKNSWLCFRYPKDL